MTVSKKEYRKILKYLKFMNIAKQIATLSYDPKHQVSAILVKKDFSNIHSMGYNGNYEGGPNERDSMVSGKSGFIHAEENALLKKNTTKEDLQENYIMFVTMTPCNMCAKKMVNAGVKEVCALDVYENSGNTEEIFKDAGVKFYYLNDKIRQLLMDGDILNRFITKKKQLMYEDSLNDGDSYYEAMLFMVNDFFGNGETEFVVWNKKIGDNFYNDFYSIISDLMF